MRSSMKASRETVASMQRLIFEMVEVESRKVTPRDTMDAFDI